MPDYAHFDTMRWLTPAGVRNLLADLPDFPKSQQGVRDRIIDCLVGYYTLIEMPIRERERVVAGIKREVKKGKNDADSTA